MDILKISLWEGWRGSSVSWLAFVILTWLESFGEKVEGTSVARLPLSDWSVDKSKRRVL